MRSWLAFCFCMWVAAVDAWELKPEASSLSCAISGEGVPQEIYHFRQLSGSLDDAGMALLTIPLTGFDSGNTTRDQRVGIVLFEATKFPNAVFLATLDMNVINALGVGQEVRTPVRGRLTLVGKSAPISTETSIKRLPDGSFQVVSVNPAPLNVDDFGLSKNLRKLTKIGDRDIAGVIPVSFSLVFMP